MLFILIGKIEHGLSDLIGILDGLPRASVRIRNIADDQIRSIHHFPVADLYSGFRMRPGSGVGDFNIAVIVLNFSSLFRYSAVGYGKTKTSELLSLL